MSTSEIAERIARVREAVAVAARDSGREPDAIRIIAASKYADVAAIRAAAEAGLSDFGENYLQDAVRKIAALSRGDVRWHLIGALQSNKAAKAAATFDLIHTLSTHSALAAISRTATAAGTICAVLIQVHLGGGAHRAGVEPSAAGELVRAAAAAPGIRVEGLMGVAPANEPARGHFARLRALRDELRGLALNNAPLGELSAGMSSDFADAIREGATMVRIGSLIFGR